MKKLLIVLVILILSCSQAMAGFWTGVVVGAAVSSNGGGSSVAPMPQTFDNNIITCMWSEHKNQCSEDWTPQATKDKLKTVKIVGYTFIVYGKYNNSVMAVIHYE